MLNFNHIHFMANQVSKFYRRHAKYSSWVLLSWVCPVSERAAA